MSSDNEVEVVIVAPDGSAEIRHIEADLASLKAAVGGGWLEQIVPTSAHGEFGDWHAYLDEEGKIKALPVNEVATLMAHQMGWPGGDYLCGPVVFLGSRGHDEADVPSPVIKLVVEAFGAEDPDDDGIDYAAEAYYRAHSPSHTGIYERDL